MDGPALVGLRRLLAKDGAAGLLAQLKGELGMAR
jgi:hypothetical protein